ncbi:MAG TPA: efflux transporter outer membrane subunit, partial [Burkholderiales bacterium]|nr:efflux transporter outer membrane subunit [Burkholderiales bacterium]
RPGGASASPFNTFELGLDASWEVDVFGRVRNQVRAAEADVQAAQADRDGVRVALLAEVARTYVEYRLYQAQTDIAQRTAAAEEGTVRITRARFEQGMSNRMELERTVSALAVTRAQIPQARTLADSARYRLAYLLASTPETLSIALSAEKPMPDSDPLRVLLAPTDVLALRPDVRAAQQRLVSAGQLREAAAALRYPRITLAGLLGVESGEVSDLLKSGSRTWSVGAGLLAPLFDFGRIRAAIDVADAQQEQAYLSYERTIRTALQETQTAIVSYTQGVVRQKEWAQAVQSSRIAANLARRQYMEGTLSLLEVLDAERSLYVAELGWAQATADVSIRLVTVYKTMGIAPAMTPS